MPEPVSHGDLNRAAKIDGRDLDGAFNAHHRRAGATGVRIWA